VCDAIVDRDTCGECETWFSKGESCSRIRKIPSRRGTLTLGDLHTLHRFVVHTSRARFDEFITLNTEIDHFGTLNCKLDYLLGN
jgi:hypothetical protein